MKRPFTLAAVALVASSLAGAAVAQNAPSPGGGAGPHWRRHGPMMHGCASQDARIAGILAFAKVRLGITPDEEQAWTTFTKAVSDAEAPVKAACAARASARQAKTPQGAAMPTAPQRLHEIAAMAQARAESLARIAPALDALYGSLTPAQQKIANELANHRPH